MKKQRNCKICKSEEWLSKAFTYGFHVEHYTYLKLIEMFEKYGISLNIYNCSVHIHRHLEMRDFAEAEATKARWAKIETQLSTT